MTRTQELEHNIRGLINAPRKHAALLADTAGWAKLCSSLDVIGDTELAMESYLQRKSGPADTGELYLLMYGILQVLYVQQDAVNHLHEALGIPYARSPAVTAVRNVRNDATGHPTNRDRGQTFHFISRITMHEGGFQMMTMKRNGTYQTTQVDVPALIGEQRREVAAALEALVVSLREEETEHRKKFRGTLLSSFFDQLDYLDSKLGEALLEGHTKFASGMLDIITDKMNKFRTELEQRGQFGKHSSVRHIFAEVEQATGRLREYLAGSAIGLTALDAEMARFYLRSKVAGLEGRAAELDAEYGKDA